MGTFNFNEDIPQSNDVISESQPELLQNFQSIDNIWNVDHYTFESATSTDGQHKQVTFAGNNVPTVTTSPPVLFTNIQDGNANTLPNSLPELFFYSGTDVQGQKNYLSTGNISATSQGSVLLFGGIVMKWGTVQSGASSVAFTLAFPNNIFNIQLTGYSTLSVFNVNGGPNVSGFSFSPAVPGGSLMFWLAIGN